MIVYRVGVWSSRYTSYREIVTHTYVGAYYEVLKANIMGRHTTNITKVYHKC